MAHAGTYGIREGERLSSVLKRAGGFRETAYPAGAVLERVEVRELGEKTRLEMIRRIESTNTDFKPGMSNSQEQMSTLQAMQQQRQDILSPLRSHPCQRTIGDHHRSRISANGKTLRPMSRCAPAILWSYRNGRTSCLVSGQVFNASAITYSPGRPAGWYLRQAGGPTQTGEQEIDLHHPRQRICHRRSARPVEEQCLERGTAAGRFHRGSGEDRWRLSILAEPGRLCAIVVRHHNSGCLAAGFKLTGRWPDSAEIKTWKSCSGGEVCQQ